MASNNTRWPKRTFDEMNDDNDADGADDDESDSRNAKKRKVESVEKAQQPTRQCIGCACELESDHTGIVCVGDHHICVECSVNFVHAVFAEPADHIPGLKCMICKAEIVGDTFDRQLTEQQKNLILYNMQYGTDQLSVDEMVAACPFCGYFEINTCDAGRLIFLCKNENCMKASCCWCKKEIKQHESEEKYDMKESAVKKHFECARLAPIKGCPNCGLPGRKNNACTHMSVSNVKRSGAMCVACRWSKWIKTAMERALLDTMCRGRRNQLDVQFRIR